MTATETTLTLRRVYKGFDGFAKATEQTYYVVQVHESEGNKQQWKNVSKHYAHSTSAYAAMGRLYQREIKDLQDLDLL